MLAAALAETSARESRQAVPIGMVQDVVLMEEDSTDNQRIFVPEGFVNPTVITTRNVNSVLTSDQQGEEQRFPYGGYYGRPWGPYGRPPGYWGGRPWGPYGRPWGPYYPYRPWGPY